jgi:hypothetical protein
MTRMRPQVVPPSRPSGIDSPEGGISMKRTTEDAEFRRAPRAALEFE